MVADCFSRLCLQKLDECFIPRQYVPALNAACKKVAQWVEEVRKYILNIARRGRKDQRYLNLLENIKKDVEPKFSKPDATLREFAESDVLSRLREEEVGRDL